MSAPAEFHRSGVVVHHQDFCTPSGLRCEPEAALDPAALERRGPGARSSRIGRDVRRHVRNRGAPGACQTSWWCDDSRAMVRLERKLCHESAGGDMRGPNALRRRYLATWLPGYLIIRLPRLSFFGASCGYCADAQKFSDYLGNDHVVVTANRIRSGSRCIRVIATRPPIQAPSAPIATATGMAK